MTAVIEEIVSYDTKTKHSRCEYTALADAYDYFNRELFASELPEVFLTFHRHRGAYGYYSKHAFRGRTEREDGLSEVALNPDTFSRRTDIEVLSTLVHEMCHVWQYECQTEPPRRSYHDKRWATKMESVGLMPSTTGMPGGKRTGQKCSHYIIEGDRFEISAKKLIESGFKFHWEGYREGREAASGSKSSKEKRKKSKLKYTCAGCSQNAWAKPKAELACGRCGCVLTCEEHDEDEDEP